LKDGASRSDAGSAAEATSPALGAFTADAPPSQAATLKARPTMAKAESQDARCTVMIDLRYVSLYFYD
jgi:hypothetical protein